MQFNDTTNKLGICQEIDDLCDSDTNNYPVAAKTRRVNTALETLIAEIINADGTWQWDDTNHTTLPIGTGNLTAGQSSYSFADEFLDIEMVKIMDSDGTYQLIKPLDPKELGNVSLEQVYGTDTGFPIYYDKQGDTIKLYPAPAAANVTLTAGIKVHFKRTASLFTAADTTKEPGIASPYHILLCYMAALPYVMAYKKDRVPLYEKKIVEMKADMIKFYSRREKDKRKVMTTKYISFR